MRWRAVRSATRPIHLKGPHDTWAHHVPAKARTISSPKTRLHPGLHRSTAPSFRTPPADCRWSVSYRRLPPCPPFRSVHKPPLLQHTTTLNTASFSPFQKHIFPFTCFKNSSRRCGPVPPKQSQKKGAPPHSASSRPCKALPQHASSAPNRGTDSCVCGLILAGFDEDAKSSVNFQVFNFL